MAFALSRPPPARKGCSSRKSGEGLTSIISFCFHLLRTRWEIAQQKKIHMQRGLGHARQSGDQDFRCVFFGLPFFSNEGHAAKESEGYQNGEPERCCSIFLFVVSSSCNVLFFVSSCLSSALFRFHGQKALCWYFSFSSFSSFFSLFYSRRAKHVVVVLFLGFHSGSHTFVSCPSVAKATQNKNDTKKFQTKLLMLYVN